MGRTTAQLLTMSHPGYFGNPGDKKWYASGALSQQNPWFILDPLHNRAMVRTGVAGGSELVTNGTFNTDLTGWTDASSGGASVSVSGGAAVFSVPTGTGNLRQAITTVAGQLYAVTRTGTLATAGFSIGTTAGGTEILASLASGATARFIARGTTTYINATTTTNGVTLDNVSVKAVLPSTVIAGTPEQLIAAGYLTYSRSDAYATRESAPGVWSQVAANVLRRKYDGSIYIEPSSTNNLRYGNYGDATDGMLATQGELISNNFMASNLTGYTIGSTGSGSAPSALAPGVALTVGGGAGTSYIESSFSVVAGNVYTLQLTIETASVEIKVGTTSGGSDIVNTTVSASYRFVQLTAASSGTWYFRVTNSTSSTTANIYAFSAQRQRIAPQSLSGSSFGGINVSGANRVVISCTSCGTAGGLPYADLNFKSIGTGSGSSITYYLETGTQINALTGDVRTLSCWLSSADQTNISQVYLYAVERTSGGSSVFVNSGSNLKSSISSSLTRFSYTITLSGGGTVAKIQPGIVLTYSAGASFDVTYRICAPMEEGAAGATSYTIATTPIITTNGAATRAADVFLLPTTNLYMTGDGALVGEYTTLYVTNPASASTSGAHLICADDTSNARFDIRAYDSSVNGARLVIGDGTAVTLGATGNGVAANVVARCAARYKTSAADCAISGNGAAAVAVARAMAVDFPTAIGLGQRETGGTQMAGTLRYISGLAKVMSNAEIAVESARYS